MTAHSTDPSAGDDDAANAVGGDRQPSRATADDGRSGSPHGRTDLEENEPGRGHLPRRVLRLLARVLLDFVVITGWVFVLTALFLATAWPRWAFYALLLGGIVGYVYATSR